MLLFNPKGEIMAIPQNDNGMTPDIALLDFACDDKNTTECLAYYLERFTQNKDYLACFIAAGYISLA